MHQRNTAIVLLPHGASMMSIDLDCQYPTPNPALWNAKTEEAAVEESKKNTEGANPPPNNISVKKSMVRPVDEFTKSTLERMRMLFNKTAGPEKGKRTTREEILKQCPEAKLLDNDGKEIDISSGQKNQQVWPIAKMLQIGSSGSSSTLVKIWFNVPTISGLSPPSVVYADIPISCSNCKISFTSGNVESLLQHEWRLLALAPTEDKKVEKSSIHVKAENKTNISSDEAPVVSTQPGMIPTSAMIGHCLSYRCRVNVDGAVWAEVTTAPVLPAPKELLATQQRWQYTQNSPTSFPQFRVVSYNILHDAFCTSNYAKQQLYPFCEEKYLDLKFRRNRLIHEVEALRPDILCLQECGESVYKSFFDGIFELHFGLASKFSRKVGNVSEGLCTAYNVKRFECVSHDVTPLNLTTIQAKHPELSAEIAKYEHLEESLSHMPSVASITVLREKRNSLEDNLKVNHKPENKEHFFIVSNTHLFYHPNGCHIRAIQAYLLSQAVTDMKQDLLMKNGGESGCQVSCLLCGDFNFTRSTAGYRLLSTGAIPSDHVSWKKGLKFWWGVDKLLGMSPEEVDALAPTATSSESSASAQQCNDKTAPIDENNNATKIKKEGSDGAAKEIVRAEVQAASSSVALNDPPTRFYAPEVKVQEAFMDTHLHEPTLHWTNYCIHFKEIIDHIFVSSDVKVVRTIPLPSEDEVKKNVAIPSDVFPSDHVPLIVDLQCALTQSQSSTEE